MSISVLITGCSTGIGEQTAIYLKEKGYQVFPTARDTKDVQRLQDLGFNAYFIDVTKKESISQTLKKVLKILNK